MAKKGQKFRKRSPEFKLSVILDMRENHLGLRETERKRKNICKIKRNESGAIPNSFTNNLILNFV